MQEMSSLPGKFLHIVMREYMRIAVRNNLHFVLYHCCCKGRYFVNIHLKSRGIDHDCRVACVIDRWECHCRAGTDEAWYPLREPSQLVPVGQRSGWRQDHRPSSCVHDKIDWTQTFHASSIPWRSRQLCVHGERNFCIPEDRRERYLLLWSSHARVRVWCATA